jgi:type I restriction enzyme S subunit
MSNPVPEGWEVKSLADVAKFIMGQAPAGKDCNKDGVGTPFVKAGEFTSKYPIIREWTTKPLKLARSGDVFMCVVGATAGKLNLGIDCAIGRSVAAIRSEEVPTLYLYNFMLQHVEKLRGGSSGSAQGVITTEHLRNIIAPFPPHPEQQKIAAILSTVDDVIEKTRAQIDKLKDLKTGMMQELLTKGIGSGGVPHTEFKDSPVGRIPVEWDVKPLSDLASSIKSGLSRRIVAQDIGIPMLISGNIKNGKLDTSELKYWYIDDPQGAETSNYILNDGDILMCFINSMSQIGKSCIYRDIGRPAIYTTNMFRIVPKPEYSSEYLQLCFCTQRFQDEVQLISKPAVNQASFTKGDLEQLSLPIPPKEERIAITNSVMAVENKINSLLSSLEAKLCVKKALMQDLLTGKVRVKVDNKESAVA